MGGVCEEVTAVQLTQCPEPSCDAPSEIVDRFVLPSTEGILEFVKTLCLYRHWFMLPVSSLKPSPPPVRGAISAFDPRHRPAAS